MERDRRADPEVDDLVEALTNYGVLTRDALREHSGAAHWVEDSFEAVLRRGVANGSIKSLGGGLFEAGDDPDLNRGRFDPS